jgi:asparagine synthase (glutamine-hydrolyzing)
MCGILGVFNKRRTVNKDEVLLMRDAMFHRGPDDGGLYISYNNKLALAHRRLSILDKSNLGHQPMESLKGNNICFNGEIYNYIELRKKYLQDIKLKSNSDTEVLLYILEKYGVEKLNELNGMWSFIYYDNSNEQLIISRDRFGVKPLYYYEDDNVFILASEIKAILKSKYYKKRINEEVAENFLDYGMEDYCEDTFFYGIKKFPSSSYMIYSLKDEKKILNKYYSIEDSIEDVSNDFDENVKKFKDILFDSISIRMRSDVPVGFCLSGGLDSSTIYSVSSMLSNNKLYSFSGSYEDKDYDESYFYKMVWEKYPGYNYEVNPEKSDFSEEIRKIIFHYEEPVKGCSLYTQWNVMKLSGNHATVLLNGQGSDELLGGYDPYYFYYLLDEKLKSNEQFKRSIEEVKSIKGENLLEPLERAMKSIYVNKEMFRGSYLNGKLLDQFSVELPLLLKSEDKISMAFSKEIRLPFLDYRLVNFMFSLSNNYKINNGWTKYILRKGMNEILPEEIQWRRDKKGYATPLDKLLNSIVDKENYIPDNILKSNDLNKKWRYLIFNIWKEIFEV